MIDRIDQEIELLRKFYPELQVSNDKNWILILNYALPANMGWYKDSIPVALQFLNGFPGAAPYGIYVPADIQINKEAPDSFQPKANNTPPFAGEWGMLSWSPEPWFPTSDIQTGSNMAIFVRSFSERFKEGK